MFGIKPGGRCVNNFEENLSNNRTDDLASHEGNVGNQNPIAAHP